MAAPTLTLAGHSLNDGTNYQLRGQVFIEPLRVSYNEATSYYDAAAKQTDVRTKGLSTVRFSLLVKGSSLSNLDTNLDNLDSWVLAGGTLALSQDAVTLLSCSVGPSTPPVRVYDPFFGTQFRAYAEVELVRTT